MNMEQDDLCVGVVVGIVIEEQVVCLMILV